MKSTRKSIFASLLALLICVALLMGATYAWFTDSEVIKSNKIQSGTLDIELSKLNGDTYAAVGDDPVFNYDLWEPGYSEAVALKIYNSGSLALKYQLDVVASGEAALLAEVIDVYALTSDTEITELPTSLEDAITDGYQKVGKLSDLINDNDGVAYGNLLAKKSVYAGLVLHMQESAGNNYQNKTLGTDTFDIRLYATQYTYETDGFGSDQYDKNAQYSTVAD